MIEQIQFHGDWSKAGHRYTETDFKLLKNAKAQNRLIDKFSRSEHCFDMHFYKGPESRMWHKRLVGSQTAEWVDHSYDIDLQTIDEKISVLITNNISGQKYPLTPWIIAHRISHSIYIENNVEEYDNIFSNLDFIIGRDFFYKKWFGCAIGTTRSCRMRTLARTGEIVHELFAQCLLTGRVNLKHIGNRVLTRKRGFYSEYKYFNDQEVETINGLINRLENAVYNSVNNLYGMYGRVIVV
jgi:hypothetical protein